MCGFSQTCGFTFGLIRAQVNAHPFDFLLDRDPSASLRASQDRAGFLENREKRGTPESFKSERHGPPAE